jgi:hypothetical protein
MTMVQKAVIHLIDDLDGGPADETITFSLDGTLYEIDLSAKNADRLRTAFEVYLGHARTKPPAAKNGRRQTAAPPVTNRADNRAIRTWARKNDIVVSPRGRIPLYVLEKYHASR